MDLKKIIRFVVFLILLIYLIVLVKFCFVSGIF